MLGEVAFLYVVVFLLGGGEASVIIRNVLFNRQSNSVCTWRQTQAWATWVVTGKTKPISSICLSSRVLSFRKPLLPVTPGPVTAPTGRVA